MTAVISEAVHALSRTHSRRVRRVCLITEAAGGGVGRHFLDLAGGLSHRGIDVTALYSRGRSDISFRQRRESIADVQFVELPLRRAIHPGDAIDLISLIQSIRSLGPFDLIHCHSSKAGALGRAAASLLRTPSVYTPHALVTLDPTLSALKRRFYAGVERLLAHATAAIIAVSPDEAEHAIQLGIDRRNVHVVLNGIDPPDFPSRESARIRLNLRPEDFCIGFVGRLTPQKAPELLIDAIAELQRRNSRAIAVVIGSGALETDLREQIARLGLSERVRLLGDMVATPVMPAFDCFCLPSRYEGLPYVLLEALAAELPIVARRVGGVAACVEHGRNGFIVETECADELAGALLRLELDPALRQEFSVRSSLKLAGLSMERMLDETVAIYESIVTERHGRR
jgi:glycosyltransferase involved in cell wall biosynthesis